MIKYGAFATDASGHTESCDVGIVSLEASKYRLIDLIICYVLTIKSAVFKVKALLFF